MLRKHNLQTWAKLSLHTVTSITKTTDGSLPTLAPCCGHRRNTPTHFSEELHERQTLFSWLFHLSSKVVNLLGHCRKPRKKNSDSFK